ncbi:hypothetical protein EHI8A_018660 [Entamoeba histolytica HM-1:IMSS-B]|uniref:Uncharacterized protein n=7 Tax=Entamoeba histolytica TaxID=5759 RepID=C4M4A5_ENTH1|nr:hypothetical protein EHI_048140 [Entamoeba histolytica HM-1:IMSS]EMD46553.1 Hypothetical protein EHI5A_029660 [Entamoeba histolytica KU27]EMH73855.1 hypothetical protein EHI8A_018660 [Entamoeba histolytica HM-1:IMSS-B]EMS13769.1 hypothetical protein KM1_033410 [Entamoeba histolytica HM-3:IMSS]ENY64193.1 hypothetical protein EHI7A_013860 [Entamoeba histolytica HM-1:IMSS-A]GAT96192.1 hypothetical protein CL6EHI_048140 [Entamoeba histolytica]|eukprot:XP_652714.1 hypothetical protein EHI_048140 [Entamoeba histolytica HM-1:IMSS]
MKQNTNLPSSTYLIWYEYDYIKPNYESNKHNIIMLFVLIVFSCICSAYTYDENDLLSFDDFLDELDDITDTTANTGNQQLKVGAIPTTTPNKVSNTTDSGNATSTKVGVTSNSNKKSLSEQVKQALDKAKGANINAKKSKAPKQPPLGNTKKPVNKKNPKVTQTTKK